MPFLTVPLFLLRNTLRSEILHSISPGLKGRLQEVHARSSEWVELQLHSRVGLHSVHAGNFTFVFLPGEIVKLAGFTMSRINALPTNQKVKCNILPAQAIRVYWGNRSIAALTLNLCTIRRWVFNLTPQQIYPPENLRYPFNKKMGGPHSRSGRFEGQKNI